MAAVKGVAPQQEQTPEPQPAPAQQDQHDNTVTYTVVSGDTLSAIADKFGTTYQALAERNGIADPNIIYPGQILIITGVPTSQPAPAGEVWYEVRPGDTLSGIAEAHGVGNYWDIAYLNGIEDPNLIYPGTRLRIR